MLSSKHLEVPNNGDALFFFSNVPESHRPGNIHRRSWDEWGNTVLRTSYDDDEKFARAIAAIRCLAMISIQHDYGERSTGWARDQPAEDDGPEVDEDIRLDVTLSDPGLTKSLQDIYPGVVRRAKVNVPPGVRCTHDWVVTYALMCRYHDVIVDDKVLDGADLSAAWTYFQANCEKHVSGLRGQELAAMTPLERAKVAWQHWIKVVTEGCNVTDEGEDIEDEISYDVMGRRRIRLFDYLDIYLRLQRLDISEVGVEGDGRERFLRYELEDEWLFCENFDGIFETWLWLEELYGEQI